MKKIGILIVCLICCCSLPAFAQSKTPEFELRMHLAGDINTDPVGFGYDPAAVPLNDSNSGYDTAFGEMYYFGPTFAGDEYLAFQVDTSADYAEIDILPKPSTDTFTLQYSIYVSSTKYPATLSWTGTIPSEVKAIIVSPADQPSVQLVDMTKENSVTISGNPSSPNYYGNWEPATVTLYYNIAPPSMGVNSSAVYDGSELLYGLSVYPNPVKSTGNLSFSLSAPGVVTISGFDPLGRQLFHIMRNGNAGENEIDLSQELGGTCGTVLLRVNASSGSQQETQTRIIRKE